MRHVAPIALAASVLLTVTLSLPGSERADGLAPPRGRAPRLLTHEHSALEHAHDEHVSDEHARHGHAGAAHDEHGGEHSAAHGVEHAGERSSEHTRKHGGHGGHGGHGEHGGHHVVADDTTFTVSVMLFMFLTVDMVLLYFVNFPDPNIRQFSWSMLSTTISIFCAVLLNNAAGSFFLEQLLPSPFPRGFGMKVGHRENIVVASGLFVFCFTMLSVSGYVARHDHKYRFAVQGIGGHITGFAFIAAGGHWQEIFEEDLIYVVLITLCFFCVAAVARVISLKVRQSLEPGNAHWTEEVTEGEDEAFALANGFLISQCVLFCVTGTLQPMHGVTKDHTLSEVSHLLSWSLVFVVFLVAASLSRSKITGEVGQTGCSLQRMIGFVQNLCALASAWMMLKVFEWMMALQVKNMALGIIIDAFVVTMMSVVMIYLLDKCADKLTHDLDNHENETLEAGENEVSEGPSCQVNSGLPATSLLDGAKIFGKAQGEILDKSNHEKALRTIMSSFSFLTGLSWEKAFDSANACVVEGVPAFRDHRVLSKISISICLVCLVLPAWAWYVVPKAMNNWRYHASKIKEERKERQNDKEPAAE